MNHVSNIIPTARVPKRSVYTTGMISKLCNVAPRTVSKWIDSGRLKGYRIPGSNDRRVPVDVLVEFFKAHGMPLPWQFEEKTFGFCVDKLMWPDGFTDIAESTLDAGLLVGGKVYNKAIITDAFGVQTALRIASMIHTHNPECLVALIVDPSIPLETFKEYTDGFFRAFHSPVPVDEVIKFLDTKEWQ